MRALLIDLYRTKDPYSGLGQFSQQFAETLIAHGVADARCTFLVPDKAVPASLHGQPLLTDKISLRPPLGLVPRFDLWHSLHQLPSHRPRKGTPWVYTVHDLNFLIEKSGAKAARYLKLLQRDLDHATVITAISHYTRAQLEQHTDLKGRTVRVIHNGVQAPSSSAMALPAGLGGKPYFLSIGVLKEKKAIHALIPLLEHFPDHELVIAGNNRTDYGERLRQEAAASPWRDRVRMLGPVDDALRNALYAHCEALLFPSQAEGFGLPVIEALALGKPVFASRATSLPEIGGDVAFYFDGLTPASMAERIQEGLAAWQASGAEGPRRARQRALLFTWENCLRGYLAAYEEALSR
jgi:glycosyltransferase involved in cell wall biosynthesis